MYGAKRAVVPLVSEYPGSAGGEPYYPMWDTECFEKIRRKVETGGLSLLGRVATYKYIDIDQAVRKAMDLVEGW
jgi:UDP-galactopyranose mutase